MTGLSTAPLEPARTPQQPPTRSWTVLLFTGTLGAFLAAAGPTLGALAYGWVVVAVTAFFSVWLAIVDEHTHLLPNRLTGALALFGTIQAAGISLWQHDPAALLVAAQTTVAIAAAYTFFALIKSTGFGDIKFAGALALTIAPHAGLLTLYLLPAAFIISSVRIVMRRIRGRGSKHPHGPSLAIAGLAIMTGSMLAGPTVLFAA